ncbi:MAG: transcriptional regulator [Thermoprotei archaeon]|nr:MAG: transcriptional regulator [Thermoprotei archaeon]
MSWAPQYWRELPYRYRLIGSKCMDCGRKYYPPRKVCKCGSENLKLEPIARKGKVYSYTVIYYPSKEFQGQEPIMVAIVETEDGARFLTQLTDCTPDQLKIGMPVEAVFRRYRTQGDKGLVMYGIKFRPVLGRD